jgi:hypothetical protein
MPVGDACTLITTFGPSYRDAFSAALDDPTRLRTQPTPTVWSPLEYAAHVRDAIRYHGSMINRALNEDRPELPVPDPDRAAHDAHYAAEDPIDVLDAIDAQARRLADRARGLDEAQLACVAIQGDRQTTVLMMVRNVAHEGAHHLDDIHRQLR